MQVNNFIQCLDELDLISSISEEEIKPIINEYPYCQTGQLFYTIQLNNNNSILFEEQLKKTASICPDRTKLFRHIHQEIKVESQKKVLETTNEILVDDKFIPTSGKDELDLLEKEYLSQAITSSILLESDEVDEEDVSITKEIKLFDEDATHSFSSWLKYYNGDDQEIQVKDKKKRNQDIINKFIQEDPRIEPKKTEFYSSAKMARLSDTDSGLVSETLALIHVDQGNFQEALKTYEKLMVRNPKKSSYFAAQIKILKQKLKQ